MNDQNKPNESEIYERFIKRIIPGYLGNQIGTLSIVLELHYDEHGDEVREESTGDVNKKLKEAVPELQDLPNAETLTESHQKNHAQYFVIEQEFADCFGEGEEPSMELLIEKFPSLTKLVEYANLKKKYFEEKIRECNGLSVIDGLSCVTKVTAELSKNNELLGAEGFSIEADKTHQEYLREQEGGNERDMR